MTFGSESLICLLIYKASRYNIKFLWLSPRPKPRPVWWEPWPPLRTLWDRCDRPPLSQCSKSGSSPGTSSCPGCRWSACGDECGRRVTVPLDSVLVNGDMRWAQITDMIWGTDEKIIFHSHLWTGFHGCIWSQISYSDCSKIKLEFSPMKTGDFDLDLSQSTPTILEDFY